MARVLVHKRGGAGEANGKDIFPAVAIEIMYPSEEVVRVPLAILRLGWIDLVLDFEARTFVPMWAIHEIDFAIVVQVTSGGTFGIVNIG